MCRAVISVWCACLVSLHGETWREAPHAGEPPYNQLRVSGNACGPAALLTAMRCGGEKWRKVEKSFGGEDDRERMLRFIARARVKVGGKSRWSRRGMNLVDLRDMANEARIVLFTPEVKEETFFRTGNEKPHELLARLRERIAASLAKGFPPVLSMRRYALGGKTTDRHFVTVLAVPARLPKDAISFSVRYVDPWGGKRADGVIRLPTAAVLPGRDGFPICAEALFPTGRMAGKGGPTVLVPAAALVVR